MRTVCSERLMLSNKQCKWLEKTLLVLFDVTHHLSISLVIFYEIKENVGSSKVQLLFSNYISLVC